jgi:hypothetical protein
MAQLDEFSDRGCVGMVVWIQLSSKDYWEFSRLCTLFVEHHEALNLKRSKWNHCYNTNAGETQGNRGATAGCLPFALLVFNR